MRTIASSPLWLLLLAPAHLPLPAHAAAPPAAAAQADSAGASLPPPGVQPSPPGAAPRPAAPTPAAPPAPTGPGVQPAPPGASSPFAPPGAPAATASDAARARRVAMRSLQRLNRYPGISMRAALEDLDEQGRVAPEDDWIVGHRVGLRIALEELDDALDVARDCRASAWWCAALLGFVLHVRGDFADAGAAFDGALAAMPDEVRCEWLAELRHVLRGDLARGFRDADCEERDAIARHVWWLADPLYLVPHNERRTEHLSRLVSMELHHQWIGEDGFCPPDHHGPILAVGWRPWWDQMYVSRGGLPPGDGYAFLPPGDGWTAPLASGAPDWGLRPAATGERYAPPDREYHPLAVHQTAYFPRGDSAIVVAALDPAGLGAVAGGARAGLYLAASADAAPVLLTEEDPAGPVRFRATVPAGPHLASLEVVAPDRAARARFTVGPPAGAGDGPWISDLLLFAWDDGAGARLEDVAARMYARSRIPRGAHVGVYWEIYGVPAEAVVETGVVVIERQGFFGRIASALRLSSPDEVRTSWMESAAGGAGYAPRALGIDLAALSPGRYRVEVTVRLGDGSELATRREIEIRD